MDNQPEQFDPMTRTTVRPWIVTVDRRARPLRVWATDADAARRKVSEEFVVVSVVAGRHLV